MATKNIKILGNALKTEWLAIPNFDLFIHTWPWLLEDPLSINNGRNHTKYPVAHQNNEFSGNIEQYKIKHAIYSVNSEYTIAAPPPANKFVSNDIVLRTGIMTINEGENSPTDIYALELTHSIPVSDLQGFITSDTMDNIWVGAVPYKDAITVENGLIKIHLQFTGIIGTASGEAWVYLKIKPAYSVIPGRFVAIELEDTKGIGLIKGIVEKTFREDYLPSLQNMVDNFIEKEAQPQLTPLDNLVQVLTGNRARLNSRGLHLASITPEKDIIKCVFTVAYGLKPSD